MPNLGFKVFMTIDYTAILCWYLVVIFRTNFGDSNKSEWCVFFCLTGEQAEETN